MQHQPRTQEIQEREYGKLGIFFFLIKSQTQMFMSFSLHEMVVTA